MTAGDSQSTFGPRSGEVQLDGGISERSTAVRPYPLAQPLFTRIATMQLHQCAGVKPDIAGITVVKVVAALCSRFLPIEKGDGGHRAAWFSSILGIRCGLGNWRRTRRRSGRHFSARSMAGAGRGMSPTRVASAVVARLLARLQCFHLLGRDEGIEFLLRLLVNPSDLLLTLLLAQGRVSAHCLYF